MSQRGGGSAAATSQQKPAGGGGMGEQSFLRSAYEYNTTVAAVNAIKKQMRKWAEINETMKFELAKAITLQSEMEESVNALEGGTSNLKAIWEQRSKIPMPESRHHGRQSSPPKDRKRPTSTERVRHRSRDATPISETASLSTGLLDVSPTEIDKAKIMDKDKKRKRQRCRDYDEKGYCMRGDSCPFDHGPDPVDVEEVSLPRMITIKAPPPPVDFSLPPPGYSVVPPPPGVDHGFSTSTEAYNPEAPSISSSVNAGQQQIQQHGTLSSTSSSYAQLPPSVWNQPPPNYNVQFSNVKPTYRSRELITLAEGEQQPSVMSTVRVVAPVPQSSYGGFRPDKRQLPSSRLQSNAGAPAPYDKTNRTLEVRRIPVSFNTITKLNEHFAQFGHITNIQIRYDDDPEAALVTFASRPQAMAAYKSPIFRNGFIGMLWHAKDANDDLSTDRPSVKDRLGPAPIDPITPLDDTSMKARLVNPTEDAEGNRREVYQKQLELQKAKAKTFTKQAEQQKKPLKQLENSKKPERKKEIIKSELYRKDRTYRVRKK